MLGDLERVERRGRVLAAERRGIRVVPANPSPSAFPFMPFACDSRPKLCSICRVPVCAYGEGNLTTMPVNVDFPSFPPGGAA